MPARADCCAPDGKLRVLDAQCPTCIFNPAGSALPLRSGRLRELVNQCRRDDSYVVCHETYAHGGGVGDEPAACRGFFDRFSCNVFRIFGRLGGIVYVPAPQPSKQETR